MRKSTVKTSPIYFQRLDRTGRNRYSDIPGRGSSESRCHYWRAIHAFLWALPFCASLSLPSHLFATDRRLPQGSGELFAALAPPDFASFPSGTFSVSVTFAARQEDDWVLSMWEIKYLKGAHRLKTVWLAPQSYDHEYAFQDDKDIPPSEMAEAPTDSVKNFLRSLRRRDLQGVVRYTPPFPLRIGFGFASYELLCKRLAGLGLSIDVLLDDLLPEIVTPPSCCNWIDLVYKYKDPGADKWYYRIRLQVALFFTRDKHWYPVAVEFDRFNEDADAPLGGERVLNGGLRKAINIEQIPDVGGFAPDIDLDSTEILCEFPSEGAWCQTILSFNHGFYQKLNCTYSDACVSPPAAEDLAFEDPMNALELYAKVILGGKADRLWDLMSPRRRANVRDVGEYARMAKLRAEKQKAQYGVSLLDLASKRLFTVSKIPSRSVGFKVSFLTIPRTDGRHSIARVKYALVRGVDGGKNWLVDQYSLD